MYNVKSVLGDRNSEVADCNSIATLVKFIVSFRTLLRQWSRTLASKIFNSFSSVLESHT